MSISTTTRRATSVEIANEMDRRGRAIEDLEARNERLLAAVEYADTRAVSRAAYPHACIEERKLRDLIDRALGRTLPASAMENGRG